MRLAWTLPTLVASLALAACVTQQLSTGTVVSNGTGPLKVVNLEQGWDEPTQMAFWFTTQGAHIVPYAWFLALEQADSTELFRSDANLDRLGYLTARPGPGKWNPDGLPVGFVKSSEREGQAWMGLSCAACHTSQVNYGGVGLRIDGGPSMADFNRFFADLVAAQQATLADAAKFQRFANRVLGAGAAAEQVDVLRKSLAQQAQDSAARLALNTPSHPAGYARLDAFGNIFNEVLAVGLGQPGNARPPDAPVSYPFIWDAPQHNKVQWNGAAPNGPFGLGELTRNVGEVLGVFGGLHIGDCDPDHCRYPNNVDIRQLGRLEGWLRTLWSPQWPSAYLPPLDQARVARGQDLFASNCAACHLPIQRNNPFRRVVAQMHDVGTDPAMATAAATRTASTGPLQGRLAFPTLRRYGPTAAGAPLLVQGAVGVLASDLDATFLALIEQYDLLDSSRRRSGLLTAAADQPQRPTMAMLRRALDGDDSQVLQEAAEPAGNAVYKARPLNGIWATAPYLHNGSVPTLWELLQPPAQRTRNFFVGSRNFDPVDVGFETGAGPSRFDVSLPGNSNAGHDFGTQLNEAQKRELIEYLKSL